jgi:hypothetical protein
MKITIQIYYEVDDFVLIKNTKYFLMLLLIVSLLVLGTIYYYLAFPLITKNKALKISSTFIEEDFELNHILLFNREHCLSNEPYNENHSRYHWSVSYRTPDGNTALFEIDAHSGELIEGRIYSQSKSLYRYK